MTSNTGFVHLHTHTEHSALDGLSPLGRAAAAAQQDGQTALAITDHGTLSGAWKFAAACREEGIKPIIGIEAYLAIAEDWTIEPDRNAPASIEVPFDDGEVDPDVDDAGKAAKTTKKKTYEHLTIIAATHQGWKNLVQIVNAANVSYFKKPLLDWQLIKEHSEGLIVLTGCLAGPVLGPVARGNIDHASRNLERIIDAVGKDNVYVEIMEHGIEFESRALPAMVELAARYDLPIVATNDSHYAAADDAHAHDGWLAIQTKTTFANDKRWRFNGEGYHLRTEAEMRALRPESWWQTAVSNTVLVAERCEDVIPEPGMYLPRFELPEGWDDNRKYLAHLIREGAKRRYGDPLPREVVQRIQFELDIIGNAGFIDYFLIVSDLIKRARARGIRVGPGRGSAAGSCISYCLGIVQVDPIRYNLLFERFLEPGRTGMPDIDVDFEQGRRHEVLGILVELYGADKVARIGSFGAAKSRRAIRDAAKLLGNPAIGDQLAKTVPIAGGNPMPIAELIDPSEQGGELFREILARGGDEALKVVDLAAGFEGAINGESIHACGTLISSMNLNDMVPLRYDRSKSNTSGLQAVTQWDGKDIDAYGLLKLDVLGLRNLDVVSKAVKFIEQTTGELIDPDALPDPDSKGNPKVAHTWELLRSGRTAGVFQMESEGMAKLAQAVKPDRLSDLSAVIALFRPGPLGAKMDVKYAARKNGLEEISYDEWTRNPEEQRWLASVLDDTYGVFVFQEQIMRLGTVISGFDVTLRSKLRKAIGKKDGKVFESIHDAWLDGAPVEVRDPDTGEVISPVFSRTTAIAVWNSMSAVANYVFNASHTYAYARLAYVTAYLKANWPAQYGAAILAATEKDDKRAAALRALREEGIEVLAPDLNRSLAETAPIDGRTVLLGLAEIKDVGAAGETIVASREQDGPFTSLRDLMSRQYNGAAVADVGTTEALIQAGALDQFGPRLGLMRVTRASKFWDLPVIDDEWGVLERAARQRTRLGVIMGGHPTEVLAKELTELRPPGLRDEIGELGHIARPLSSLPDRDGESVLVYGILADWAERAYSKGRMGNLTLESADTVIRGVIWDNPLKALRAADGGVPPLGSMVTASGRVQVRVLESEGEDGETIETTVRELSITRMDLQRVNDNPRRADRLSTYSPLRDFVGLTVAEPEAPAEVVVDVPEVDDEPFLLAEPTAGGTPMLPIIGRVAGGVTKSLCQGPRGEHAASMIDSGGYENDLSFDDEITAAFEGVTLVRYQGRPYAWILQAARRPMRHATWPDIWEGANPPTIADLLPGYQPQVNDAPEPGEDVSAHTPDELVDIAFD